MKALTFEVMAREGSGKGVARKLRREGLIPAVIYGRKSTRKLACRLKDLQQVLKGEGGANAILELTLDGKKKTALLKDVQYDPIRRVPIHADIFEVSMDQTIRVMVEVKATGGDPVGFKKGGILTSTQTEVEVECLPLEIPDVFEAELSSLDVGDAYHVSDLPDLGVKVLTAGDQVLFAVVEPTIEAEPVEEEVEEVEGAPAEADGEAPAESDQKPEASSEE
jgi:large subunit ribosomal protein L25